MKRRGILITGGAVALLLLVGWLIWRPSLAELEEKAQTAREGRLSAEQTADASSNAKKAELDNIRASQPDLAVWNAKMAQVEALIASQNAQISALGARLATRTEQRSQSAASLPNLAQNELQAKVRDLVGEPLQGSDSALRNVVRLGIDLEQARDEVATKTEVIAAKDEQLKLERQLRAEVQGRLEDSRAYADRLDQLAKSQQETFDKSLIDIRTATNEELRAKDEVIKKLRGNKFWRAVKTGTQVGAGIGIGVIVGKAMSP